MSGNAGAHEQPGLEVNYQPGLEVDTRYLPGRDSEILQPVPYQNEAKPSPLSYTGQHYGAQAYQSVPTEAAPAAAPATATRKRSRKVLWIVVGVVAVLVIIGAVLGGVLGSRTSEPDTNDASSGSSTSNATSLENIRSGSRLAVTGYRDGSNYRMRLFYQGPDQKLRVSSYASNESSWSDPIVLTGLEHAAGENTPLAASLSVESTPVQYKLIYVGENSVMRGHGYIDAQGQAEQGARLALNDYPLTVPPTSRLASYWPFIISQDSDGHFRWTRYWPAPATTRWENSTLGVIGSTNAGMVVLPASSWYFNMGGFVYRRSDGKMMTYLADQNNNDTGTAWGSSELSQPIPEDSPIGGFAVARPASTTNQTNTYLLYQDKSGTIQVVSQDDTTGWKGPQTFSAFDNADNGTDIACLTPAAWDEAGVEITSNQQMNRCYFQVGNKVREVFYDGSKWNDEGYLPIT
ncbi:hypothetical protein JX265_013333 [Neoarthrinium moseri]|uniref:Fucose-specific lectin n=1 Tax=Neoarthrinium moseri TaxID=1658444 RepID=A0A9P9W8X4_9PEZI|nr:uncharacterized protein JN550_005219 [Neoarthrinium moseri]KAI1843451.1 hypothetical protein JX266_010448 [Neoarthrinium moseri]KAI1850853.1 hypothetical protein JX265_013333 [Neoarthrinium moseri]KAI1870291.1 hypothetical protein JN550_005219 [Neoarthrinium moseri]